MDISTLTSLLVEQFVAVIFVASLIVGYIIKNGSLFKKVPNNDIPGILAIFGGILNAVVSGPSVESVVYGAFMGLASTGAHQMFKSFIEGKKSAEIEVPKEDE